MKYITLLIVISGILLTGCTENTRAKSFGGKMTVNLPPNTKLVNATWKNETLWYLYVPMNTNDTPKTTTFQEKSSFGVIEGTVVFVETR